MAFNKVVSNSFTSKIAKNHRLVEETVFNKIEREQTTRSLVQERLLAKEVFGIVKMLTKKILTASSEDEIDHFVHIAHETSISFHTDYPETNIDFALRVRNAELNAHARIAASASAPINPLEKGVACQLFVNKDGEERVLKGVLADNWGQVTQLMLEGYRIVA